MGGHPDDIHQATLHFGQVDEVVAFLNQHQIAAAWWNLIEQVDDDGQSRMPGWELVKISACFEDEHDFSRRKKSPHGARWKNYSVAYCRQNASRSGSMSSSSGTNSTVPKPSSDITKSIS